MEDSIPSISTGAVGSRFVSQADIEAARARREEQWKVAYARSFKFSLTIEQNKRVEFYLRLGQEPPPQPVEDSYDGRSLAEVSTSTTILKLIVLTSQHAFPITIEIGGE